MPPEWMLLAKAGSFNFVVARSAETIEARRSNPLELSNE